MTEKCDINKFLTEVRPDVLTEIEKRGKNNADGKMRSSIMGFGPTEDTLIVDKSIYNRILNEYDEFIKQLCPAPVKAIEDDLEELFADDDEDHPSAEHDVDERSIDIELEYEDEPNPFKKRKIQYVVQQEVKRMRSPQSAYPRMVTQWFKYWTSRHQSGNLQLVPRAYTTQDAVPSFDEFIQTDIGETILKFNQYLAEQFY